MSYQDNIRANQAAMARAQREARVRHAVLVNEDKRLGRPVRKPQGTYAKQASKEQREAWAALALLAVASLVGFLLWANQGFVGR